MYEGTDVPNRPAHIFERDADLFYDLTDGGRSEILAFFDPAARRVPHEDPVIRVTRGNDEYS
jgi:hypothetical protein